MKIAMQGPELSHGKLLGFFWTSSRSARFVLVMSSGLHLFEFARLKLESTKSSKQMQMVANDGVSEILWYKYEHHCRLLLLGGQFDLLVLQITAQV
jgi:hypothetical protein